MNNLKTNKMNKQDLAFCIFYGAIVFAGLAVALTYWYNEIFKKK
jgi:hypothetical protein